MSFLKVYILHSHFTCICYTRKALSQPCYLCKKLHFRILRTTLDKANDVFFSIIQCHSTKQKGHTYYLSLDSGLKFRLESRRHAVFGRANKASSRGLWLLSFWLLNF